MGKKEWEKNKYKTGKIIVANRTMGRYAPQGQPVEVTWTQGLKTQSQTLQLDKIMTIEQTSDHLYIKVKPTLKGMAKVTLDIPQRQYSDHKITIVESSRVLGLSLVAAEYVLGSTTSLVVSGSPGRGGTPGMAEDGGRCPPYEEAAFGVNGGMTPTTLSRTR